MLYSVHITNRCNLNCFYCYEDNKPDRTKFVITTDEIDERMKWIDDQGNCTRIELLGGEVFLYPDLVQYILDRHAYKYEFIITTNGSIRNAQIDDMIKRHNPHLGISLDWPGNVERFRHGLNFHKVLQNALDWKEYSKIIICSVVHPHNITKMKETYDFYVTEKGFGTIHFGAVEEWMKGKYYWDMYIKEAKRLIDSVDYYVLDQVTISPWKNYRPYKKKIIMEGDVEKMEIFAEDEIEQSEYQEAKRICHEYMIAKINRKGDKVATAE